MTLFKNKYRVESIRLKDWDYSSNGYYYITICTKNREHFFGEIKDGEMVLNEIGKIVDDEWNKSFIIRSELFCDCYIIMPNHVHGIIRIHKTHRRDTRPCVSTESKHGVAKRKPKSVSSFVAGFKSSVTKNAKKINKEFSWQSRYYDHIIHNENDLNRIRKYIKSNPDNWNKDKENKYRNKK